MKYGYMRQEYLAENKPELYAELKRENRLSAHCKEIDLIAINQVEKLVAKFKITAGATEELKAKDPMKWVGIMNSCKQQAEEIVYNELIFV